MSPDTPLTHKTQFVEEDNTVPVEPDERMLEIRDLALSQAHKLNFKVRGKHCRHTPFHERVKKNRLKEKNRRLENKRKRKR